MEKEIIRKGERYDLLYIQSENSMYLKRYILHDGYFLWEVSATDASFLKPLPYYVAAQNKREAKKRFLAKLTWLNVIKSIEKCSANEVEDLLQKPENIILI